MKTFDELKKALFDEASMAEKLADTFSTEKYATEANTLLNLIYKLGLSEEYSNTIA